MTHKITMDLSKEPLRFHEIAYKKEKKNSTK
jgi:hypothetical protein